MPAVSIWLVPLGISLTASVLLSIWSYQGYLKTLGSVKSTWLARRLRPIARERARLTAMREGDEVFYGDIVWGMVRIYIASSRMKPYPHYFFQGIRGKGVFSGSALCAHTDQFHHTLWQIQFDSRPKRRIRMENRIRRAERRKFLRQLRTNK